MKIAVAINQIRELGPRQTTAMLIASLVNHGHCVFVAELESFQRIDSTTTDGESILKCRAIPIRSSGDSSPLGSKNPETASSQSVAESVANRADESLELAKHDLLLIRTSPGRDPDRLNMHESFLQAATAAQTKGLRVVNSPQKLWEMASKEAILKLDPKFRPLSVVSRNLETIFDFASENFPCIVKPLLGSRGEGVMKLTKATLDEHALQAVQELLSRGDVIAQEFVESEQPGDTRIVVMGGKVLEVNGRVAAIRRVPAANEFRANLHTGGTAHPAELSSSELASASHAAQLLHQNQVWLAGVDLVGDKVIEFNVFSTGGLFDAERFTGVDFCEQIVRALVETAR